MTRRQLEALRIIAAAERPMRPRDFAEAFWPGHKMHSQHRKGGRGVIIGGNAGPNGGAYLGKLKRAGWIRVEWHPSRAEFIGYVLSVEGRRVLDTAAQSATSPPATSRTE